MFGSTTLPYFEPLALRSLYLSSFESAVISLMKKRFVSFHLFLCLLQFVCAIFMCALSVLSVFVVVVVIVWCSIYSVYNSCICRMHLLLRYLGYDCNVVHTVYIITETRLFN